MRVWGSGIGEGIGRGRAGDREGSGNGREETYGCRARGDEEGGLLEPGLGGWEVGHFGGAFCAEVVGD